RPQWIDVPELRPAVGVRLGSTASSSSPSCPPGSDPQEDPSKNDATQASARPEKETTYGHETPRPHASSRHGWRAGGRGGDQPAGPRDRRRLCSANLRAREGDPGREVRGPRRGRQGPRHADESRRGRPNLKVARYRRGGPRRVKPAPY